MKKNKRTRKNSTVFMVKFDWAMEDEGGSDEYIYKNREDAKIKFNNLIKDELNPDTSWVSSAFEYPGIYSKLRVGYELETKDDNYWSLWKTGNYLEWHTTISIQEMPFYIGGEK